MIIDDYKPGSNVDPEEARIFDKGITCVEVTMDESSRLIVIPLDCDLLEDTVIMVPSFSPLCSVTENMYLQHLQDSDLSLGISKMAFRVSFCIIFTTGIFFFSLLVFLLSFSFLDFHFLDGECQPRRDTEGHFSEDDREVCPLS